MMPQVESVLCDIHLELSGESYPNELGRSTRRYDVTSIKVIQQSDDRKNLTKLTIGSRFINTLVTAAILLYPESTAY
jgi:hypothetical protein